MQGAGQIGRGRHLFGGQHPQKGGKMKTAAAIGDDRHIGCVVRVVAHPHRRISCPVIHLVDLQRLIARDQRRGVEEFVFDEQGWIVVIQHGPPQHLARIVE